MKTWQQVVQEAVSIARRCGLRTIRSSQYVEFFDKDGILVDQIRIERNDLTLSDKQSEIRLVRLQEFCNSVSDQSKSVDGS